MPYRLTSRSTALVLVVALLLLPATVATAAPPTADAPAAGVWQQTWNLFAELFAGWFGGQPAGNDRATSADQIGSLLDPDGFTFDDPNAATTTSEDCDPTLQTCGEIGSLLDPDG